MASSGTHIDVAATLQVLKIRRGSNSLRLIDDELPRHAASSREEFTAGTSAWLRRCFSRQPLGYQFCQSLRFQRILSREQAPAVSSPQVTCLPNAKEYLARNTATYRRGTPFAL
jgi:hypothetical protein